MFQAHGDFPFVKIYFDDITIHSIDFPSHLHHIKQVLQRLTKVNLKLNSTKCLHLVLLSLVMLLLLMVSTMDPAKVEAVQSFNLCPFLTLRVRNGPSVNFGTNIP